MNERCCRRNGSYQERASKANYPMVLENNLLDLINPATH